VPNKRTSTGLALRLLPSPRELHHERQWACLAYQSYRRWDCIVYGVIFRLFISFCCNNTRKKRLACFKRFLGSNCANPALFCVFNVHYWLRVPQRVEYKLSVLVYRCLHNLAPEYLCDELRHAADFSSRQRLRSSSTSALIAPPTRLSTVDDRAFPTAASRICNSLPLHVTSAPSLQTFKKRLKSFLFSRSFPP